MATIELREINTSKVSYESYERYECYECYEGYKGYKPTGANGVACLYFSTVKIWIDEKKVVLTTTAKCGQVPFLNVPLTTPLDL